MASRLPGQGPHDLHWVILVVRENTGGSERQGHALHLHTQAVFTHALRCWQGTRD